MSYFWIAIGSTLGGMARHWCTMVATAWFGAAFPWGTLFINILGSFVIGMFFAVTVRRDDLMFRSMPSFS